VIHVFTGLLLIPAMSMFNSAEALTNIELADDRKLYVA